MNVSFYNTVRLTAVSRKHGGSCWVELRIDQEERRGPLCDTLTIFFDNERDADAYAHAINGVVPFVEQPEEAA